ncbi:uncharacterized protein [Macrobrachium rosenbergii]|uniref:uncharacterized protein isoform X2 n=2 Tax=Macrobrachium rosenbergii TaxID=79674 RepID=UPI0034D3F8B1
MYTSKKLLYVCVCAFWDDVVGPHGLVYQNCNATQSSTYQVAKFLYISAMKYLALFLIFSVARILGQELCRLQSGTLGTCTLYAFCPYVQAMSKILSVEKLVETYGGCGRGSDGNVQLCCPNDKSLSDGRQGAGKLPSFTLTDTTSTSTTPRPTVATTSKAELTCEAPLYHFDYRNCIFLSKSYTGWEEAQQICQNLGAQLYTAPNPNHFLQMRKYLLENSLEGHFWVGVHNRTWLDGRAVAQREWRSGEPDGAEDECGFMGSNGTPQSYFLYDFPCDGESHAICHKRLDVPN